MTDLQDGPPEPPLQIANPGTHMPCFSYRCSWCNQSMEATRKRDAKKMWEEHAALHRHELRREMLNQETKSIVQKPNVCESKAGEKQVQVDNRIQEYNQYFEKLGLARIPILDRSEGLDHNKRWVAWVETTPKRSFASSRRKDAQGQCARDFLMQLPEQEQLDSVLPLFQVSDDALIFNPPKPKKLCMTTQALDIEWDASNNLFVCAAVARCESEVYIFTDYQRLLHFMDMSTTMVVFASENDRHAFPHVFTTNPRLQVIDLRKELPKDIYSPNVGLATLVASCLQMSLDKNLQRSFRHNSTLTQKQALYVAADALATLQLYFRFVGK